MEPANTNTNPSNPIISPNTTNDDLTPPSTITPQTVRPPEPLTTPTSSSQPPAPDQSGETVIFNHDPVTPVGGEISLPESTSAPDPTTDTTYNATNPATYTTQPSITPEPIPPQPAPLGGSEAVPSTSPGTVVSGAFMGNNEPPVSGPVFGGDGGFGSAGPPINLNDSSSMPSQPRRVPKRPLLVAITVVVLIFAALGYYFGYYMNSSVILSQSLSNTGKGYTKLVDYFNQQSQVHYKGSTASGSYSYKSDSFSTDGSLSFQNDGQNSDTSFDIGLAATRAKFEIRTIKPASSNTPDIYLKADGISGLGALTGSDQIDKAINQVNGKWIVIDHSLTESLGGAVQQSGGSSSIKTPTQSQVMDEVRAFGKVNQQYVFTTSKSKSVTTVVKTYGTESVGGHKAYHYKMALNKAHIKQYITAQLDALKASQLGTWLKKNGYQSDVTDSYNQLEQSADSIKSSDTFDVWADVHNRVIYKIRISDKTNPAANYVDIGLDYNNGKSSYPFFISGQSKGSGTNTSVQMVATLDTKKNDINFNALVRATGVGSGTLKANMLFKPSNDVATISAPSGAESLSQLLDQLGLSDLVNSYLQSGGSISPTTNTGSDNTLLQ